MTKATHTAYVTRLMDLERPLFRDGMILTADDLEVERAYHIGRSRLINRAVFGSGIACGLEVHKFPEERDDAHCICVSPGIAFDCIGDPFELCRAVRLDLDPDSCNPPPDEVCVLIRKQPNGRSSGDGCDCGTAAKEGARRVRDAVEIRVVASDSEYLDRACRIACEPYANMSSECDEDDHGTRSAERILCECLTTCTSCSEDWVLLACVKFRNSEEGDDCTPCEDGHRVIDVIDSTGRQYIKPIRCHCPPGESESDPTNQETPVKISAIRTELRQTAAQSTNNGVEL